MQSVASSAVLAAALLFARPAGAQEAAPPPHELNQVTLEVGILTAHASYARRLAPRTLLGVGVGGGLSVLSYVAAGDHFSDEGMSDKSFDLYEGRLFARQELSEHVTLDVGVRAARVLRVAMGDLDVLNSRFVGAYVTPMFGWRIFQLGPTVSAGVFSRSSETSQPSTHEFGVRLTALTGRLVFRF
jgi:hypothetical protein